MFHFKSPFYFPCGVIELRCENNKYYFMNNDHTVRIMDKSSGILLGSVKLNQSQMYKLDSNGNLIVIELTTEVFGQPKLKLKYLSSRGECQRKISLLNFPSDMENVLRFFAFDNNDKINFFNYHDFTMHSEHII